MVALRAALVTPLSGRLKGFGRAGAEALSLWAEEAADLPRPFDRVELAVHDARPDTRATATEAVAAEPHLVFGPYGSGPARTAATATGRLMWNHGGASSALTDFPHVINVLAPASSYFAGVLQLVHGHDSDARTVAVLHGDTGFGRDVAGGAAAAAARLGLTARRQSFSPGDAEAAARALPNADVLLVAGPPDDEVTAARALLGRSWPAAAFVAAGEEHILAELGQARQGLLGPAQWLATAAPDPDEGPTSTWFVRRFTDRTGEPPSYPAVQAFATGILATRALRDAGESSDTALRNAATRLSCTTLYGSFEVDAHANQVGHRVLTVQWQQGQRRVVWPPTFAQTTLIYPRA